MQKTTYLSLHLIKSVKLFNVKDETSTVKEEHNRVADFPHCIVLYSSIYIAPLNSHGQTEALLVQLAPRKETR